MNTSAGPLSGSKVSLVAEPYGARCRSAIRTSLAGCRPIAACLASGAGLCEIFDPGHHLRQLPGGGVASSALHLGYPLCDRALRYPLVFDLTLGLALPACLCLGHRARRLAVYILVIGLLHWHYNLALPLP